MNDLKKHAVALGAIALLVIIKFVFIPILDWQDNALTDIALQQRKVAKINLLVQSKDVLTDQETELIEHLQRLNKRFYSQQNGNSFKRKIQKTIEDDLKLRKLKIKNIGWQTTTDNPIAPLTQYSINYSFSGKGVDMVNYILAINASDKYSQVAVLNISFSEQRQGRLGYLSARLQRVFYMSQLPKSLTDSNSSEVEGG